MSIKKITKKFKKLENRRKIILIGMIPIGIISLLIIGNLTGLLSGEQSINGGNTPMIVSRTVPSSGYSSGYGDIKIGGEVNINQFYATSKAYISTVTVKWWESGHSTKQTIFSETLASNTYSFWSKTKSIYFSSGTYYVSILVTTTGATAYGTKSYQSSFTVTSQTQAEASASAASASAALASALAESEPFVPGLPIAGFEFPLLMTTLIVFYLFRKQRRKDQ